VEEKGLASRGQEGEHVSNRAGWLTILKEIRRLFLGCQDVQLGFETRVLSLRRNCERERLWSGLVGLYVGQAPKAAKSFAFEQMPREATYLAPK
jgi:hypothetical protein